MCNVSQSIDDCIDLRRHSVMGSARIHAVYFGRFQVAVQTSVAFDTKSSKS